MKKILIVEDETEVREILVKRAQKIHQLDCKTDSTGKQCLSLAQSFRPDVILLDMCLPELNGFDLIRGLKNHEETKAIPIIVFSAHNHYDIVEHAMDIGANSYYSKGNSMQNLFEAIMEYAV